MDDSLLDETRSPFSRGEPGPAFAQQALERLAARGRQAGIHPRAVAGLKIGEMAVALRKASEQLGVETEARLRIDRIDTVFFVDHRALDDPPSAVALLDPVEEAALAHGVDLDSVEPRA